ncbi:uncharacterized protein LOC112179142 isoform X4 [Rosa chinensis]|uniref:uncharacterized protein LOC112179142 isoform X4 n=1 Tax=Rosa chinensis TaxID=74649 RepID=UPI001AD8DB11|nr:uncharacterized protein LOC112179142 isoform X4 [Rosa chinensis]
MAHDLNTNEDSDDVMTVDWSTYGYINTHPSLKSRKQTQKEEQSKIKQEEKIIITLAENFADSLQVHTDDNTGIDAGSRSLLQNKGKKQPTWRIFSLKELHAATNNFNYDYKLGEGGFGSLYWGQLWDGSQKYTPTTHGPNGPCTCPRSTMATANEFFTTTSIFGTTTCNSSRKATNGGN